VHESLLDHAAEHGIGKKGYGFGEFVGAIVVFFETLNPFRADLENGFEAPKPKQSLIFLTKQAQSWQSRDSAAARFFHEEFIGVFCVLVTVFAGVHDEKEAIKASKEGFAADIGFFVAVPFIDFDEDLAGGARCFDENGGHLGFAGGMTAKALNGLGFRQLFEPGGFSNGGRACEHNFENELIFREVDEGHCACGSIREK
jgi:hypothetical protein